eukprot:TRINITY_DN33549_c0_g1_i1.p1 TRINITY_DN33549_c0_g1~~TRINITY_DN33549_c0_g1_i1.p1  ORF type:complete len:139 (+),score=28.51 TRINITY_DN33549_c0_g1_i1:97-513(+)
MIRRPPRSTQGVSSAASDVYKRQVHGDTKWYPRKKIEVMRAKLEGRHPVLIIIDELAESEHGARPYFPRLKNSLIHTTEDIAKDLNDGVTRLSEPQQITECIIEMAHNPDILGRTWTCLLYTSPSPRDLSTSRMPSSA